MIKAVLGAIVGVICPIFIILYILCDMSIEINEHLRMIKYEVASGEIWDVEYIDNGGAYIWLKHKDFDDSNLKDAYSSLDSYILSDRSVITKSDIGKHVEILYHFMRGKSDMSGNNYIEKLSIEQKVVWSDSPMYIMDFMFILLCAIIIYYSISEIYKKTKQGTKSSRSV